MAKNTTAKTEDEGKIVGKSEVGGKGGAKNYAHIRKQASSQKPKQGGVMTKKRKRGTK